VRGGWGGSVPERWVPGEGAEGLKTLGWCGMGRRWGSGGGVGCSVNAALVRCLGHQQGVCRGEAGPVCGLDLGAAWIQNGKKGISVCPSWRAGRGGGCRASRRSVCLAGVALSVYQAPSRAFGSVLLKTTQKPVFFLLLWLSFTRFSICQWTLCVTVLI